VRKAQEAWVGAEAGRNSSVVVLDVINFGNGSVRSDHSSGVRRELVACRQ
jgi:hypothetical protein